MPMIGKLFSKDQKAYQYLSTSAQNFPFGEVLNNILRKIGFIDVQHLPQTMGVATIYKASKIKNEVEITIYCYNFTQISFAQYGMFGKNPLIHLENFDKQRTHWGYF